MLPLRREGERGPLLVMLHWLGGGAQTWSEVSHGLALRGVRCAAVDLPGFGNAAAIAGYNIRAMADAVIETVRGLRAGAESTPWLIAGHSMGGTVAALVAREALDGVPGLSGLRGMVLVSPSPPGPEPMSESKRSAMLESLGEPTGDESKDRRLAAKFVDENTGKLPLPEMVRARAIEGVLGMNRTAFRRWLELGSKEDWREPIGRLAMPALVFAGPEDGALGPDAQRQQTMPHLVSGELVTLEAAGHLGPLERPGEMIEYITEFAAGLDLRLEVAEAAPGSGFDETLQSQLVSPKTHAVMEARLAHSHDWNHKPTAFSAAEFRTLRALAERVVPNAGFDLAAQLDEQIALAAGDGWRFAALPPDAEAWHRGLLSLDLAAERAHGVRFVALYAGQQDALLTQAAEEKLGRGLLGALRLGESADAFTAAEMRLWFSEVRSDCTRLYMGNPRTMNRIGYTGFADDLGFTQIQLGQQEEFRR